MSDEHTKCEICLNANNSNNVESNYTRLHNPYTKFATKLLENMESDSSLTTINPTLIERTAHSRYHINK